MTAVVYGVVVRTNSISSNDIASQKMRQLAVRMGGTKLESETLPRQVRSLERDEMSLV